MNFLKFVITVVLLFMSIQNIFCGEGDDNDDEVKTASDEITEKWAYCREKCGGDEAQLEAERNGELICAYNPRHEEILPQMKCMIECEGFKAEDDQTKCMCEYCKSQEFAFNDFCTAPKAGPIKSKEECDSLVCTGKAVFRGDNCESPDAEIR